MTRSRNFLLCCDQVFFTGIEKAQFLLILEGVGRACAGIWRVGWIARKSRGDAREVRYLDRSPLSHTEFHYEVDMRDWESRSSRAMGFAAGRRIV